ncbi:O-antigen/teichoic acid export membrane protein [Rhodoblastus acidophilus]|uniref:oligosaccharide flippase family protein n=1 Tax=Rhodoblastus acidophilus TaxID=1074 RepID=UPI002223FB5B|nr:oligosaccharide flippase family protein [Rhodoblastus acidophilus]MCW2285385.1 O-antigen/teichoic acid export membrane protein [Rhodoblastus acidophilus]MCW2334367.1 O-antigen/teichoic acid export membrane protein [Rhodoblastus acidophilus]
MVAKHLSSNGFKLRFQRGSIFRKTANLSVMTAAGQFTFVLFLPLLSHLYTPADFGVFTVYLSLVNILGPVVSLKFDSALYGAASREEARPLLLLALISNALVSLIAVGFFASPVSVALAMPSTGLLVPIGLVLTGLWSTTSAWAIRNDALSTLATARFVQPVLMTILQVVGSLAGSSSTILIVAHIISHSVYSGLIFWKTLHKADLKQAIWNDAALLRGKAWDNRLFPLLVTPANVASQLVANAPPILMGLLYGAEIAGLCGMALRFVFAPIAIISLPLGHVFTSLICNSSDPAEVRRLGRKILATSFLIVCAPLLVFGALAPLFAGPLLGDKWAATGQIASALAVFAAGIALVTPFNETTSIFHFQKLRFIVEAITSVLVFATAFVSAFAGASALTTIWLLSAAGAFGSIYGMLRIWSMLQTALARRRSPESALEAAGREPSRTPAYTP